MYQSEFRDPLAHVGLCDVGRHVRLVLQDTARLSGYDLLKMVAYLAEHWQNKLLAIEGFTVFLYSEQVFALSNPVRYQHFPDTCIRHGDFIPCG